ncbi:MAG TPA: right-handed parallel beta-helix repeat-containing protein [Motilibacterales bacterium]|nr:right-handed parallel beta-helix repeat-containing protein [Motilibacterales bacterium]
MRTARVSHALIAGTIALGLAAPAVAQAAPRAALAHPTVATPSVVRADGPQVSLSSGSAFAPGARVARFKTVNSCTRDYYMIRSWMEHFEAAGGGTLTLAPGTYRIPSTIYVPSNTTIALSAGTTLLKTNRTCTKKFRAASSMFMLVPPSLGKRRGAVGGYGGAANIAILGAGGGQSVIDLAGIRNSLGIIAGHNQNVRIEGIRFTNMNNNHFIEMDANANSVIRNNEFLGATGNTRMSAEAVNLDTPDALTDGFGSTWSNLDATANTDVLVQGNVFANLVRGLGTHNFSGGRYHTRIAVVGNTFTGMRNDAVRVMNWRDSAILGNTFDGVWCPTKGNDCRGILASGAENLTVRDNVFANMARAMQFMPWANAGKAAAYGVTYNALTDNNLLDLRSNVAGPGLQRPEAIINPEFRVFWPANLVRFSGA